MDPNTQELVMGAAGASASPPVYIEDVFSTWLYTGNGSTQTITNEIDLSGKGGLVWIKNRVDAYNHRIFDTARGATKLLESDTTSGEQTESTSLTSFTSSGFTLDSALRTNRNGSAHVSWTFRKAPKFFDVVTWTGDGTNNRAINHSLTTTPRVIIIKRTDSTSNWAVYSPASLWTGESFTGLYLNTTAAVGSTTVNGQGISAVGASSFTVISSGSNPLEFNPNTNGATYVAYLFAHNAGGFGDSGNDSVVSCGSFTTDASGDATVTLGWEPQWVLIKNTSASENWKLVDTMRGFPNNGRGFDDNLLNPNLSAAEATGSRVGYPTANGFFVYEQFSSNNYIYIAIRRGPMKMPTDATKVFSANTFTDTGSATISPGFPLDAGIINLRSGSANNSFVGDRLRGGPLYLRTSSTAAETSSGSSWLVFDQQNSYKIQIGSGDTSVSYAFRRAPGFFDVVAYTGPGAGTVSHGLGVKPQLYIVKSRTGVTEWRVYAESQGATKYAKLHLTDAFMANASWLDTEPTSSVFTVSSNAAVGASGSTYIAYLFATCPGVSKVGSYTGTGTTLNVDCGFTNGARFVLIKRADSTGDWYVWDTARGIVSGNDPYLLLNSTAAEVTNTDYIDPLTSGFQISSTAPAAINANGGSFIFLAIA